MNRPSRLDDTTQLGAGASAEVHAYGDGCVVKLFRSKTASHLDELHGASAAVAAGVSAPAPMCEELVEIGDREGILYERVDGPTMQVYLERDPARAEECGRAMAAVHTRIHACRAPGLQATRATLEAAIRDLDALHADHREALSDMLHQLPDGDALCHYDLYPQNLMLADDGWKTIDWAMSRRGNPLADHARTWAISRNYLRLTRSDTREMWNRFWVAYFDEYRALNALAVNEFEQWKTIMAAASSRWSPAYSFIQLEYVCAALADAGVSVRSWSLGGGLPTARVRAQLMDMTIDDLAEVLSSLDDQARREYLVSLERYVGEDDGTLLTEGLLLAIEGNEPAQLRDLLEWRARTMLCACAQHERLDLHRRHCMVIRGVLGIQAGDNPAYLNTQVREAGERGVVELATATMDAITTHSSD
ncbi:phosphotransferase family protein [Candidatus Latescibacterota bacterium]